ncbi:mediator of RNA polymerase II transcription subunit 15 isoform X2 [Agrilus planipennis]|uniref:Mediator of RNA polymerase II transcription subunit 15 n=1 Tax=Agrilus planipennis TaxID=224129 RepID=A0A1W4XUY7_AGRPL|nr:mediator of RNA polymerase II transcription subunit 15 isoform X2 [Agrilus planipennis]
MADDSWRTAAFRQSIVTKIEEVIRQSGMPTSRNSVEMESHVFQKAKTREEYLGFVARLILHVREMNTKKGAANMPGPGGGQPGAGMPDPINALQNLASQGSRNNQMMGMGGPQGGHLGGPQQMPPISASNLLQTLNRGPGQNLNNMPGNMQPRPPMMMSPNGGPIPGQMGNQMGGQIANQISGQMQNTAMNQMTGQLTSQLQVANQMGSQLTNQMTSQLQNQLNAGIQGPISNTNQLPSQLQNQIGGPLSNQMLGQIHQIQQRKQGDSMMMNVPNTAFPRNQPSNQFVRQSPSPSVQSPVGLGGPPLTNQMVASPALAPSPNSQINLGAQRSVGMAPSPSSSLNTPGQPGQSPMGMQEEQIYREKVRQLSKYIEPLRKMIAKMGNDDVEKLSKMKKLLEILSNPTQRMPLETLLKCEVVLEKQDFRRHDVSVPPPTTTTTMGLTFKEHHAFNPLLEAVSNNLQSPVINHTLQRTFGPTLEALFGPEIKLVPPLKRKRVEEPSSDIPDVLQGEIARLDQRFKVSLDLSQQPGSKTIQLLCWLDDKHLPCVPPVSLTVPEDYPKSSPKCHMASHEYNATKFLSAVQEALLARIKKLPKHFSVSQLLDTWEMSVRQASAPSYTQISTTTLLMGL